MITCPKCNVLLGHCPNFCNFCGEEIPKDLVYRQRIEEDIILAKLDGQGYPTEQITRLNPIEPCNAFIHWSLALTVKQISKITTQQLVIRFCGNCGSKLPDLTNIDDAEIAKKLQSLFNE